MYQRILVPIDGSPTSTQGLDEAIRLAKVKGGRIRLLHVLDELASPTGFGTGASYLDDILPRKRLEGQRILDKGRDHCASRWRRGRNVRERVLRDPDQRRRLRRGDGVERRPDRHRHARPARRRPMAARQ